MNASRSIRKRLTRNPARAPEIIAAYRALLGREPTLDEITQWERKWMPVWYLRRRIARTPEASMFASPPRILEAAPEALPRSEPESQTQARPQTRLVEAPVPLLLANLSNEDFVRALYEQVMERHPSPAEMNSVVAQLRSGAASRPGLLAGYFASRVNEEAAWARDGTTNDTTRFSVMGTGRTMKVKEWHKRARNTTPAAPVSSQSRFPLRPRKSEIDVSIICSLWKGGDFIERYLDNITSQTIFNDRCELIIIDAASPEGEEKVIARYAEQFGDRIVYHRMPYRAGIYVAWNVGVGLARGQYLTNANLDDLRREDSIELQTATLDALPHVDVVYQDYLYSADPTADYTRTARAGVVSDLPLATRNGFFFTNPPHNAPMWRATLHDRFGLFDEGMRSAGDYDLWIRAAAAGATFYKINDPHVVYYYNPEGISTSRETRGLREARDVMRRHGRALIPEAAVEPPEVFLKRLGLKDWPTRADGQPISRYALVQLKMRTLAAAHGSNGNEARP